MGIRRVLAIGAALAAAGGAIALGVWMPSGSPSSYPYDELALLAARISCFAIGGGMALALVLARRPVFWRAYSVAVLLAASAGLLACVWIARIDWYAGSPDPCFLDEEAVTAIALVCPVGFLLAIPAAVFAIGRARGSRSSTAWGTAALVALVPLAHGVRFASVASLRTYSSADALIRVNCDRPDEKPWLDPSCGTVKRDLGLPPSELVAQFLQRSFSGEILGGSPWVGDASVCPGHEPGTDAVTVITGYKVTALEQTAEVATFSIDYQVAGAVDERSDSLAFTARPAALARPFSVVKTPWGWKLQEGVLNGGHFVSPEGLLRVTAKLPPFSAEDRRALEDLSARPVDAGAPP